MAKFKLKADYLIEQARVMWYDGRYSDATDFLLESLIGLEMNHVIEIIDYKKTLIDVDGGYDYVDETEDIPSDYPTYKNMLENAQSGCCGKFYSEKYDEHYDRGLETIRLFQNYEGHCAQYEDGELDCYGDSTILQRVVSYDREFGYQLQGFGTILKKNKYHYALDDFFSLLPEVQKDLSEQIPFYMSAWMRERSGILHPYLDPIIHKEKDGSGGYPHPLLNLSSEDYRFGGGFGYMSNKSILRTIMPDDAWYDKDMFNRICDAHFVYGDSEKEDIRENMVHLLNKYKVEETQLSYEQEKYGIAYESVKGKEIAKRESIENEEEEQLVLTTDFKMESSPYAWVSRDGTYFPSPYIKHDDIAKLICKEVLKVEVTNPVLHLELTGWLRIHTAGIEGSPIDFTNMKTNSVDQINRIKKYCNKYKLTYPEYVEE